MKKPMIYAGAGLLAMASSIGEMKYLGKSSYEARQNAPQVDRVFGLERELFKLTGGLKGEEALEKYINDSQFRESYTSLTNQYNSFIEQPNINEAHSTIQRNNTLAGFNGMVFGAGIASIVLSLFIMDNKLRQRNKI